MLDHKLTIVIGAGATYAEGMGRSIIKTPPLDNKFYQNSLSTFRKEVKEIAAYFDSLYHIDILKSPHDSLEKTMSIVYTDLFDTRLNKQASNVFTSIIKLFNKKLATTTNTLKPNYKRQLYRILIKYLEQGIKPENISIITFNQDIHIEKVIDYLSNQKKWKHKQLFSFPECYGINISMKNVTKPTTNNIQCFNRKHSNSKIKIYKLHGSMNWYSPHNSKLVDSSLYLNSKRELFITRRKTLDPEMRYKDKFNRYTFPIIIPPVINKSQIMNPEIKSLWIKAEKKIVTANEIIFWGYSLPELDFESKNLFKRSISEKQKPILINPESSLAQKYLDTLDIKSLLYFKDANSFLNFHQLPM